MTKMPNMHGISLTQYFDNLISETVRDARRKVVKTIAEGIKSDMYHTGIKEKSRQEEMSKSLSEEDDDLFDDEDGGSEKATPQKPASSTETPEEPAAPSKTVDAESEKLKKGDITSEDIVDKLNTIRGGKSFKEEPVAARLKEYVGSLSKAERVALMAFLKGIAQIVTGEVLAPAAANPGKKPADVEMQKGDESQKKHLEPNVIKAPAKVAKKSPAAEDTKGPTPITPVKK